MSNEGSQINAKEKLLLYDKIVTAAQRGDGSAQDVLRRFVENCAASAPPADLVKIANFILDEFLRCYFDITRGRCSEETKTR